MGSECIVCMHGILKKNDVESVEVIEEDIPTSVSGLNIRTHLYPM